MSLKIALVLTASLGGIGRHAAGLAERLIERGHHVTLFCPAATRDAHGFNDLELIWHPLTQLVRARSADVVHAHGYKAAALAAVLTRPGPPLAASWHNAILAPAAPVSARRRGIWLASRGLQRFVARTAAVTLGASSDLVATADALGARRARLLPVAAPRLGAPQTDRASTRAALGLASDETMVLTVSRLAPQKNLGLVLDLAARFGDRAGLRFVLAGDGPARQLLAARIEAESLGVRLLGRRQDVADLLQAADVALLTSTWEARALFAQEALCAGVPLVSTDVGGIGELVGDAAELFEPGDVQGGVSALRNVLDNPDRRQELRDRGRRRAATWPDEEAVTSALIGIYRELAGRPAAGPIRDLGDPPIG